MNRLFDEPLTVFNEKMLKPETQNLDEFVDGINNIVEAQQKVALSYFEEGSVDAAIPPLKVLLHIMAYGEYEGKTIDNPEVRAMFVRENVINSAWYKERLKIKQQKSVKTITEQIEYCKDFMSREENTPIVEEMNLGQRLKFAEARLNEVNSEKYLEELIGTIGADPLVYKA